MKSTYTEHMPLQVVKESIVRRTEYKEENTPADRMRRMEQGKSPYRCPVVEEEIDFTDEFHRRALLMTMVNDMTTNQYSSDALHVAESILIKELQKVVAELDDDLPFK